MRQALVKLQIAIVSGESGPAVALVGSDRVLTDAVDAGSEDGTFVDVFRAVASGESGRARASVVADAVNARTAILARVGRSAVVDILQAEMSSESGGTTALVAVDEVETLFTVDALHRETFVDVVFTVHSLETYYDEEKKEFIDTDSRFVRSVIGRLFNTWKALAVEIRLGSSCDAAGAILAGRTGASVKFFLTMATHKFRRADAGVIGDLIDARAVIPAQVGQTVVAVDLAPFTWTPTKKQNNRKSINKSRFIGSRDERKKSKNT